MDSGEEKDNSAEFGKVIDALHSKQKLPSLRTYQGDMAEFIKEKNESVISIAVKEREKKEEEKWEEKLTLEPKAEKSDREGFQMNFVLTALSLLLLLGGGWAALYVFDFFKEKPTNEIVVETEIIPYNNSITLANVTEKNLGAELAELSPISGINVIMLSDMRGSPVRDAKDFFSFLKISLPGALERTLEGKYVLGILSQSDGNHPFVVFVVNDFGQAFSAMLGWEKNMEKDLAFLIQEDVKTAAETNAVASSTANTTTTTASTTAATTTQVKIPLLPEGFDWKDVIIKNKDTRALVNQKGQVKIAYTFLDKNTIFITDSTKAVGDMSSAYASRSFAR